MSENQAMQITCKCGQQYHPDKHHFGDFIVCPRCGNRTRFQRKWFSKEWWVGSVLLMLGVIASIVHSLKPLNEVQLIVTCVLGPLLVFGLLCKSFLAKYFVVLISVLYAIVITTQVWVSPDVVASPLAYIIIASVLAKPVGWLLVLDDEPTPKKTIIGTLMLLADVALFAGMKAGT